MIDDSKMTATVTYEDNLESIEAEVVVYLDSVGHLIARALRNKKGKAVGAKGALKVKIIKKEKRK